MFILDKILKFCLIENKSNTTYPSSLECWRWDDEKREINSLLKAMDEFKLKEGLIITENFESEMVEKLYFYYYGNGCWWSKISISKN